MKTLVIIVSSLILASDAGSDQELWLQFKHRHGRDYRSLREDQTRYSIFQQNLRKIAEHNEKYERGEKSYYLGINEFADMSKEEFRSMLNYSRSTKPDTSSFQLTSLQAVSDDSLPEEVDWRTKNAVTAVKHQLTCSSCWSFAAVGSLEGAYAIKYGKLVTLSEQNLLDCSSAAPYNNHGCTSGAMQKAFNYVQDYGIEAESDYPYTARVDSCKYVPSKSVLRAMSHMTLQASESVLKLAIATVGPMAAAVDAAEYQLYGGGVFNDEACGSTVDHGVVVVGYGTDNGNPYWIVKNSWGPNWGENGYIRMIRDKNNQCAIASDVTFATIA